MKNECKKFPNGFFSQHRQTLTMKEATKDIIPFEWNYDNSKEKKKIASKKRK